eukprot:ANDGO_05010.mRNA.1 hypothetical protein
MSVPKSQPQSTSYCIGVTKVSEGPKGATVVDCRGLKVLVEKFNLAPTAAAQHPGRSSTAANSQEVSPNPAVPTASSPSPPPTLQESLEAFKAKFHASLKKQLSGMKRTCSMLVDKENYYKTWTNAQRLSKKAASLVSRLFGASEPRQ